MRNDLLRDKACVREAVIELSSEGRKKLTKEQRVVMAQEEEDIRQMKHVERPYGRREQEDSRNEKKSSVFGAQRVCRDIMLERQVAVGTMYGLWGLLKNSILISRAPWSHSILREECTIISFACETITLAALVRRD